MVPVSGNYIGTCVFLCNILVRTCFALVNEDIFMILLIILSMGERSSDCALCEGSRISSTITRANE